MYNSDVLILQADVVVCSFNPMLDSFGGSAKSIELVEGVQFFDEVNAQRYIYFILIDDEY